ncbi:hypothetical protein D3C73_1249340 [compost metagenome]
MGCSQEPGLIFGRGKVDTAVQHMAEEAGEHFAVRILSFFIVRNRMSAEVGREGAADPVDRQRNAVTVCGSLQAFGQADCQPLHFFVHACALQYFKTGDSGRDGGRVAGHGSGLVSRSQRSDLLHDMLAAAVSADRQAASNDFAECGQVRDDILMIAETRIGLGRAVMETESGDDFVVNDQ